LLLARHVLLGTVGLVLLLGSVIAGVVLVATAAHSGAVDGNRPPAAAPGTAKVPVVGIVAGSFLGSCALVASVIAIAALAILAYIVYLVSTCFGLLAPGK
jgi:hypothetical protein